MTKDLVRDGVLDVCNRSIRVFIISFEEHSQVHMKSEVGVNTKANDEQRGNKREKRAKNT